MVRPVETRRRAKAFWWAPHLGANRGRGELGAAGRRRRGGRDRGGGAEGGKERREGARCLRWRQGGGGEKSMA